MERKLVGLFGAVASVALAVVLSAGPSARAATVIVTDYGAVGTGNEADAATNVTAFHNAFAAAGNGGTVIVPDGVYFIDAALSMNNVADLTLKAENTGQATIKRVSTGTEQMDILSVRSGAVVEGLIIDGNRPTSEPAWSFGIRVDWGDNVLIKDCTIQNCPFDGILVSNSRFNVTVDGCTIRNNHRQGMAVADAGHGVVVKNCTFTGNDDAGLDFEPDNRHTGNHQVLNCTFDNEGLLLFGASAYPWNVTIDGCNFINGSTLYAVRAMNTIVRNCTFDATSVLNYNATHATDDGLGKVTLDNNTGIGGNGVNLLNNGGFENWTSGTPDNWTAVTGGTYTIESSTADRAIEGSAAAHLSASGGSAVLQQTIAITGGRSYTFGGYISTNGGRGYSNPNDPVIAVEFLDSGSSVVKTVRLHGYYDNLDFEHYEKVMGVAQAPAGAVSARVSVGLTAAAFEAFYDGLFFFEGIGPDGGDLTVLQVVLRFDFEPAYGQVIQGGEGRFTHPDYIHVDPNTVYDAQVGYGFRGFGVREARTRGPVTDNFLAQQLLGRDFVISGSQDDHFLVDVFPGTWCVRFAGGDWEYDTWMRFVIDDNGETYGLDNGNVIPAGAPLKLLELDNPWNVIDIPSNREGDYNQVRCFGHFGDHPPVGLPAELLYLDAERVTVLDGQIAIGSNGSNRNYAFLELALVNAMPPQTCEEVKAAGLNLISDLNGDCHVDLMDFSILAEDWATCVDPQNENCDSPF